MNEFIVVLEDNDSRAKKIKREIEKRATDAVVLIFDNAPAIIAWLNGNRQSVRLVLLDHDLGPERKKSGKGMKPGTGRDVVKFLSAKKPCCPILIHSANQIGSDIMVRELKDAGWTVERIMPFSGLKGGEAFWSRISALLKKTPSKSK